MAGMRQQMLYGGNMSILLPPDAIDVSEIRQIPDNQEVFTHTITDQSIIIEILEFISEDDQAAVKSHFEEIGQNNCAQDLQIASVESLPMNHLNMSQSKSAFCLHGYQHVAKFNETSQHTLDLWMGLFRLPQFQADIIVTFNDPQDASSEQLNGADAAKKWIPDQFKECLLSLNLIDSAFLSQS